MVFFPIFKAFMVRLKEALVTAVETRYVLLEDDIQRQSQMPEPRFCPLFVAKENLALLHERCNRLEVSTGYEVAACWKFSAGE